ncbi:MAG: ribokinase [Lachnospiraceae bacterium]|nr:ribokinase [Lachnospiraceae bacterium]MDD3796226.1 ribokinase [Lachnospiraceae bacterium]
MKVLNYGSLNVDYVYALDHIVQGGETILSSKMEPFCGGKGLNQSIALAKAGVPVYHAGLIGEDGDMLLETCRENGVNTDYIRKLPEKGGHTIIQVDRNGQNCIILYGGTNQMQTKEYIDEVLGNFAEGDFLILQNEVNLLDYIIDKAYERGMKIVLNPSPFDDKLKACDLTKVYLFMLNEIEGEQFTGYKEKNEILTHLTEKFPNARFVLTLGSDGAVYFDGKEKVFQDIFKVKAVDTTAAGDTFTGFFMASIIDGMPVAQALKTAAKASSIAVSRPGATPSIPTMEEVKKGLAEA